MDGVSIAASIISIATAGIQVSIKLVTLSTQISSAPERVSSIGNDVSLTSGVLHQLGELMTQKATDDGVGIFSQGGLETTRASAAMCERIFKEVEKEIEKASEQLRGIKRPIGGKIKLSKAEKLKWPFLQPSIDLLRADLREAKGTLMLMLQVATLALSKKMADLSASASTEQGDMIRAIVAALQQQQEEQSDRMDVTSSLGSASTKVGQDSDPTHSNDVVDPFSATSTDTSTRKTSNSTATEMLVTNEAASPSSSVDPPAYSRPILNMMTHAQILHAPLKRTRGASDEVENTSREINDVPSKATDYQGLLRPTSTLSPSLQSSSSYSDPDYSCMPSSSIENSSLRDLPMLANFNLPDGIRSELNMFMLRPIVEDHFDKVELSWSIHNRKMHHSAIKSHLARMQADGLPSFIDTLETLSAYEHSIIDTHIAGTDTQRQGSLLSLKRTRTDIHHRDILFKGVPGLQFVVEPAGDDATKRSMGLVITGPLMAQKSAYSSEPQLRPKPKERSNTIRSFSPMRRNAAPSPRSEAAVVEFYEFQSRDRHRPRSRSRIRQGVPIAAAGLGSAAIAGIFEKKSNSKGKVERREEERPGRGGRHPRARVSHPEFLSSSIDIPPGFDPGGRGDTQASPPASISALDTTHRTTSVGKQDQRTYELMLPDVESSSDGEDVALVEMPTNTKTSFSVRDADDEEAREAMRDNVLVSQLLRVYTTLYD